MIARAWHLILLVWACGVAHAHDSGIAHVIITESSPGQLLIESRTRGVEVPAAPVFPKGFTVSDEPTRMEHGVRVQRWSATRSESLRSHETVLLPWAIGGAFISAQWWDGTNSSYFFTAGDQGMLVEVGRIGGTSGSIIEVIRNYVYLGVEHILFGWDHLAFVIAMFLMSRGRGLIKLVTGFTIGHSVTLGAAALGWIHLPAPPVEAAIALSIVLVAAQSLGKEGSARHGFCVVLGFGLLHGLGFAGALAKIGMPQRDLLTGLMSFNVGVELGQLAFVAGLVTIAAAGRCLSQSTSRPIPVWARSACACTLIAVGSFWTIERVLKFTEQAF